MSGDNDGDDVKRWLGSALSDEPPLRLDRDAVLRQGRRRLRNRRLLAAGGSGAAVVAAVVGTVLVTGLVSEEPSLPPAAGQTERPPVSASTTQSPPSSTTTRKPPSASTVDDNSVRLMAGLTTSGLLPDNAKLRPPPGADGEVTFRLTDGRTYQLTTDVHTADGDGSLSVLVEPPGVHPGTTCDVPGTPFAHCDVREEYDLPMAVAVQKLAGGELRRWVRSARPDGTFVTVVASNLSESARQRGDRVSYDKPTVVPEKKLIAIAALPEFVLHG
ncbi:hypothetical protein [Actinophytocola gossypii]|uniref:PASTA domain-containing protein n=1 Tax=Actinophytocola gossypii TaxID=2812003 RepID=A0ABT2JDK9_9PSEU|nr:hypothetical protein [Actinophytocola gossypii]MCT2585959.1 hypothetical protein [Actinophytocola gossypii]